MRNTEQLPNREEPVGAVFHRAANSIRRGLDLAIAAEVSPELTGVRGMVLGHIAHCNERGEPVYQRDLETRFHIRRSSVTVLLQAMEQDGYIERHAVAKDARLKSLTATEKGLACFDDLQACIRHFEQELRQGIPPEELDAVYAVIARLLDNLQAQEAKRKEGI